MLLQGHVFEPLGLVADRFIFLAVALFIFGILFGRLLFDKLVDIFFFDASNSQIFLYVLGGVLTCSHFDQVLECYVGYLDLDSFFLIAFKFQDFIGVVVVHGEGSCFFGYILVYFYSVFGDLVDDRIEAEIIFIKGGFFEELGSTFEN